MRAVLLDVPQAWLDERRRKGLDSSDELWDGELHVVPPASEPHQDLGSGLLVILRDLAIPREMRATYETGVFRPGTEDDYRVPDLVVTRLADRSTRGVEGRAVLAVEIRSPDDETYQKFDFYAAVGVEHLLVIEPTTRAVELYRNDGARLVRTDADPDGSVTVPAFDLGITTVSGPHVRLTWPGGTAEI